VSEEEEEEEKEEDVLSEAEAEKVLPQIASPILR